MPLQRVNWIARVLSLPKVNLWIKEQGKDIFVGEEGGDFFPVPTGLVGHAGTICPVLTLRGFLTHCCHSSSPYRIGYHGPNPWHNVN